jgi:hypothetical protein
VKEVVAYWKKNGKNAEDVLLWGIGLADRFKSIDAEQNTSET